MGDSISERYPEMALILASPLMADVHYAYSRVLDDTEILIAMNLDTNPRNDFITADANLTPAGKEMVNLLKPESKVIVNKAIGRHIINAPFDPHEIAIFKLRVD